jgi:hypothetical protein
MAGLKPGARLVPSMHHLTCSTHATPPRPLPLLPLYYFAWCARPTWLRRVQKPDASGSSAAALLTLYMADVMSAEENR